MKRYIKNTLLGQILVVFGVLFVSNFSYAAEIKVTDISVDCIEDNSAEISWTTSAAKTKGIVYVGEDENNLNRTFRYSSYSKTHKVEITDLEEDRTYFYKIVVVESSGKQTELFVRSFETEDMKDTEKPDIEDFDMVFSSNQAALFRWKTNEETSAIIEYGKDSGAFDEKVTIGGYETINEKIVDGLESGKRYYARLTVYDRDKNKKSSSISFTAGSGKKSTAEVKITDIKPTSFNESLITANSVKISFKTSMPAQSEIVYGTDSNKLREKIVVSELRNVNHSIKIDGLKANTTYFYQIKVSGSFYNKKAETEVMSFRTGNLSNKFMNGSLVRGRGDTKVYFINGYTKAWISSGDIFTKLGYRSSWVIEVDPSELAEYEEIDKITSSSKHPNGALIKYANSPAVYLIEDGKKRPFGSAEAFNRRCLRWDWIMTVPDKERYTTGDYIS